MPVLQARVTVETKAAWRALATRSGLGESELLRQAITAILASNAPASEAAAQAEDGEGTRIRLQFRDHEISAIERAARRLGWRRNTWIVSVVRNALFREPRTTVAELAALHRANTELLAVGRNLNQLARALHKDDRYKGSITVEKLDGLRETIASQVSTVQAVLDAAENRWAPPESFRPETSEVSR